MHSERLLGNDLLRILSVSKDGKNFTRQLFTILEIFTRENCYFLKR